MSRFPGIGVFEIVALYMKVTMVNDYNYAHNKTSLTSKVTWGQEDKYKSHACVVKSSLWLNGLLATSSVKMQLQYDISMRMKSIETLGASLASNSLEITSLILDGREQNQPILLKLVCRLF